MGAIAWLLCFLCLPAVENSDIGARNHTVEADRIAIMAGFIGKERDAVDEKVYLRAFGF
jgi:hypothetical protein